MLDGFRLLPEALRLIRREPRLRRLAILPLLLSMVAVFGALAGVVVYADPLWGVATGWMPDPVASWWLAWLWVGPAKLLLALLGGILFLLLGAAIVLAALLVAGIGGAPLQDLLSRRVEEIVTGRVAGEEGGWLRPIVEEAKRLSIFLGLQAIALAIGLALPVVAPFLAVAVAIYFLPMEYAGFAFDRRAIPFRDRRRWLGERRAVTVGFGVAAFLALAVPVANVLALPVLVVAGTLLAIRYPAERSA